MEKPNLNVYWIGTTGLLASWFTIGINNLPPESIKNTNVRIHLFGSAMTCLACAINIYASPNTYKPKNKILHTYIGRIGVISSVIGMSAGLHRIYSLYKETKEINGQMIGLSVAGISQIYCTIKLAYNIKKAKELQLIENKSDEIKNKIKKYYSNHIEFAHMLYFGSCIGPFWVRIFDPDEKQLGMLGRFLKDKFNVSDNVIGFMAIGFTQLASAFLVTNSLRCLKQKGSF